MCTVITRISFLEIDSGGPSGANRQSESPETLTVTFPILLFEQLKNGKIDVKMVEMQAKKMLPPSIRDTTLENLEKCKDRGGTYTSI